MARRKSVPGPLDVTVKSAKGWARELAPTWGMVRGYKDGTMSAADYTRQYRQLLANFGLLDLDRFSEVNDNHVTFLCYCPDGAFCHTHLLIDWLCERFPDVFEDGREGVR
jgi:uncharacterized protein YeaO (DUF488 family)